MDDAQLDSLSTPTPDPDRFARSCASSCPFTWCTGLGSTDHRAHRCHFSDLVPELGPCGIEGCELPATRRLINGRRCDDHTPTQPDPTTPPTRPSPAALPARVYGSTPCNVRSCKVPGHG